MPSQKTGGYYNNKPGNNCMLHGNNCNAHGIGTGTFGCDGQMSTSFWPYSEQLCDING